MARPEASPPLASPILSQGIYLLPFAFPFALRAELLPLCDASHHFVVFGTVFIFATFVAILFDHSIVGTVCTAFSALIVLIGMGGFNSIPVIHVISYFMIDWFYVLFCTALASIPIGVGSCYLSGFLSPDFNRPIRDRRQASEDRARGMVYILVGVGVFLVVMSVIADAFYLWPPCEVTEWSQWSPCGKYNFEVMQRMRYVYRQPGYLGKPCGPLVETRWCSLSSLEFDF